MSKLSMQHKTVKSGARSFTPVELESINKFVYLKNKVSALIAQPRKDLEARIHYHEVQMKRLDANIAFMFPPLCHFVPLTKHELNEYCWAMYQEDVGSGAALNKQNLKVAVKRYNEQVRQRHMLKFLETEEQMEQLMSWTYAQVGEWEAAYNFRAPEKYRALLEYELANKMINCLVGSCKCKFP